MAPVVAFFNNRSGVGKTSLAHNLSWMFADRGHRVVAADLDPQADLTTAFLDEAALELLWPEGPHAATILGAISSWLGVGDVVPPPLQDTGDERVGLLAGDPGLSRFEDELSSEWPDGPDARDPALRLATAFHRLFRAAAGVHRADVVLVDLGPNLGALNRAALVAADHVLIPLTPDLLALQSLKGLGPTLRSWRTAWADSRSRSPLSDQDVPAGAIVPIGYVLHQRGVGLNRPGRAHQHWAPQIPLEYSRSVLDAQPVRSGVSAKEDSNCLASLSHYRSLMPMAQEARKAIFHLRPADGAIGAHQAVVARAQRDFNELAQRVEKAIGLQ